MKPRHIIRCCGTDWRIALQGGMEWSCPKCALLCRKTAAGWLPWYHAAPPIIMCSHCGGPLEPGEAGYSCEPCGRTVTTHGPKARKVNPR